MAKDKFSNLQVYILTTALRDGGQLKRETIFRDFMKKMPTRSSSASVSRSMKSLKDRNYITILGGTIHLTDDGREIARKLSEIVKESSKKLTIVNTEPKKVTPDEEEEPKMYLYVFGAKVHYVDPNSPEQQKRAREFRIKVTAENIVDALKRAEEKIRQDSGGFEFSIMTLFGSSVTIFPLKKKE